MNGKEDPILGQAVANAAETICVATVQKTISELLSHFISDSTEQV